MTTVMRSKTSNPFDKGHFYEFVGIKMIFQDWPNKEIILFEIHLQISKVQDNHIDPT